MSLTVLATDLDGTFIPLTGNQQNERDLKAVQQFLATHALELVYVTGRHFASVQNAITQYNLPHPDWIICDVGTTIMRRNADDSDSMHVVQAYFDELARMIAACPIESLADAIGSPDGMRKQEPEKQGPFKLSYYAVANRLQSITAEIDRLLQRLGATYSMIASVDPFNGDGLIDLLPHGVSKAFALRWWAKHVTVDPESIMFAGDSGNDLAALTAGYRTIVVKNAAAEVIEKVHQSHREAEWEGRLFVADQEATSGVLQGLNFYVQGN